MRRLILDFGMYLAYFVVLWYFLIKTVPLPTVSLKMHEALADLLLDEEFSEDQVCSCIYCYVLCICVPARSLIRPILQVLNHKKTHGDVATLEELWQWVDGPLFGAFYDSEGDDRSPQPLLGVTHLLGSVQIRQSRVQTGFCTDTAVKFFDELEGPGRGVPGAHLMNRFNYTDDDHWCTGAWDDERGLSQKSPNPLEESTWQAGGQTEWIKHWKHTERVFDSSLKGSTTFVHSPYGVMQGVRLVRLV
jgi:hypothetical protein